MTKTLKRRESAYQNLVKKLSNSRLSHENREQISNLREAKATWSNWEEWSTCQDRELQSLRHQMSRVLSAWTSSRLMSWIKEKMMETFRTSLSPSKEKESTSSVCQWSIIKRDPVELSHNAVQSKETTLERREAPLNRHARAQTLSLFFSTRACSRKSRLNWTRI